MTPRPAVAAATFALLFAIPPAEAHLEPYSEAKVVQLGGDYSVYLNPQPAPLIADVPFEWSAFLGVGAASTPVKGATVRVTIQEAPAAVGRSWPLAEVPGGYGAPTDGLPENGTYNLTIDARIEGRDLRGNTTVRVYKNIGATIAPKDAAQDATVNTTTRIALVTLGHDGKARDAFGDLTVRIEHWNDAHTVLYDAREKALERKGGGEFLLTHEFEHTGMHHLLFASDTGGFGYNDTPLLHIYATRSFGDDSPEKQTPAAVGFGVVAAAIAAFALRRRNG